jgi:hypothetical protein
MATMAQPQTETVNSGKLLGAAALGGVIAAVLNLIVYFVLPPLLGVTLRIPDFAAPGAFMPLPFFMVAIASIVPAFVGAAVLWLLARFTSRPITIFRVLAAVVTVASVGGPLNLGLATNEAIPLAIMHIIAGTVITYFLTTRAR